MQEMTLSDKRKSCGSMPRQRRRDIVLNSMIVEVRKDISSSAIPSSSGERDREQDRYSKT